MDKLTLYDHFGDPTFEKCPIECKNGCLLYNFKLLYEYIQNNWKTILDECREDTWNMESLLNFLYEGYLDLDSNVPVLDNQENLEYWRKCIVFLHDADCDIFHDCFETQLSHTYDGLEEKDAFKEFMEKSQLKCSKIGLFDD